jgi:hypothetical protein
MNQLLVSGEGLDEAVVSVVVLGAVAVENDRRERAAPARRNGFGLDHCDGDVRLIRALDDDRLAAFNARELSASGLDALRHHLRRGFRPKLVFVDRSPRFVRPWRDGLHCLRN